MKLFLCIKIPDCKKLWIYRLIILSLLLLPSFHISFSQSFIEPGNRWDYIEGWWWNGSGEIDTTSYYASEDTVLSNGKTYNRVLPENEFFRNYIRADSAGVWYFIPECNDEWLFYSYKDTIGQIRFLPISGCDSSQWEGIITKTWDTIGVVFGDTLRVLSYEHLYNMEETGYVSITPGLGFIDWSSWGWNANYFKDLKGCIVSGTVHGTLLVEVDDQSEQILSYNLEQNYPNPFNPSTTISYSIPEYSNVTIKVFDILGNEIATLVDEEKSAGAYELTWNAANLPSGVYFYQLKAGPFIESKKMMLTK